MVYLIIGLALLFIVGPIFALRPSARDRRLARIRQAALARGCSITPVPAKNAELQALIARNPHLSEYGWSRYEYVVPEGQAGPENRGEWVQRKPKEGGLQWEPVDVMTSLPSSVAELLERWQAQQAEEFLSVRLTPRSSAIVWNESGDMDEVTALCDTLEILAGHNK